tara:strand:- start:47 stop:346 length:300 start_codon:yes stop_codon:yes gene_type:complete
MSWVWHTVRAEAVKDQLTEFMQLLSGLPGAPTSSTNEDLRALREAATVVVFRMMFLGEIEARGLLWARGTRRRHLFEAATDALDAARTCWRRQSRSTTT